MNFAEFAVIAVGLVVGYWAVSKLFFSSKNAPPPPAAPAWHQVLQVSPQAAPEQIREAYLKLSSQSHADQAQSIEIANAYRAGLQAHGLDA